MVTSKTKFDDYEIWNNWRKHEFPTDNHEEFQSSLTRNLLIINPEPHEKPVATKGHVVAEWDKINEKGWSYEKVKQ